MNVYFTKMGEIFIKQLLARLNLKKNRYILLWAFILIFALDSVSIEVTWQDQK